MSASWRRLRKLTDDFLLDHQPDTHLLTQELQVATTAWARDLDEIVRLRAELAEARAALRDLRSVGERTVYLATDGEWYDKHAAAIRAAMVGEDKP